ncbi:hypothetical protein [Synechococcus phage S-B64]|uniref:Uncharacterized protein n=2 Tax=Shandvirus TaxID=2948904 RepID=A0A1Z1LWC8_9CAUD|nr:hypothetical protein KNT63_gp091 [Synechococcus phage S-H35]YP_010095345.1 hypothetical protein KNT88_gp107 [Synechococcus phage S-B64]ARW56972.1 hypothetical protein [Synechococcus phage S-H35]AWD90143.1 hypothetical protein [Synechococcus phage S-B64]
MIQDNTPSKMREIIMDTWPQLYWLKKETKEKTNDNKYTTSTNKGVV